MKSHKIPLLIIFSILSFSFVPKTTLQPVVSMLSGEVITTYSYDPYKTEYNPLRGFFPYVGEYDSFPYSMEFFYVPLKDVMDGFDSYTFDQNLEPILDGIASRNHQAIFRVFLDYPDEPTGIPDFLLNGLTVYPYDEFGGGFSPDYTNETLISTLEAFIAEFGKQYDGDTRVGFIQVGLLGHWGEWHTYPHDEWFPGNETQNRILYAFDQAFNQTRVLVRYPAADSPQLAMGYHDDSFAYETIGTEDWEFYNKLVLANVDEKWMDEPIGGEVYPDFQKDLWDDYPPADIQDFNTCVELTHVSWLLSQDQFDAYFANRKIERAREASLKMGYQYFVQKMIASENETALELTIEMINKGNAPFYYPITLKIGVEDNFTQIEGFSTESNKITLLPEEVQNYTLTLPIGSYQNVSEIAIKLDSEFVNRPIVFANAEVKENGLLELLPTIQSPTEESAIELSLLITFGWCVLAYLFARKLRS